MGLNVLVLNGLGCLLHIAQYSAGATVIRVGGMGLVGRVDAVVVAGMVFIVGADANVKVGIAAFNSGKCPSNNLTLLCFLLAW